ncbi:MAG TPA: NnrS family protein [Candidatus Polarisedimenticolia bacterium]|nr:NnrS family protein [Candidatus Polarisedimenticolia bacterium]
MPTAAVPAWRREPYRLFFPLGALLAWAGVLHWLLHALDLLPDYEPVFHSIAQIQGFMMCFATGFLFTAIPRRTGTGPPSTWQMLVGLAAPVATTAAAWYERLALSQACWLALVATLASFAVKRFLSAGAGRRPPNSFLWIPLALATGVAGSALIAAGAALGEGSFWLHDLGRLLLLQGMFLGLVCGVGGMVLPLIARGDAPPDASATRRDHVERAAHAVAALALALTFWIEAAGNPRTGLALRGAVVLAVLLAAGKIAHPPRLPGWHRGFVWLSAWMIPAGYALAAAFPLRHKAGLHVVFIGGFALMALTVGLHVTLSHGGGPETARGRPWQVPAMAGLILAAMAGRALVDFDRERFFVWLGLSSALFLAGTVAWGWLTARVLLAGRAERRRP